MTIVSEKKRSSLALYLGGAQLDQGLAAGGNSPMLSNYLGCVSREVNGGNAHPTPEGSV
jgi:hypothetical protein